MKNDAGELLKKFPHTLKTFEKIFSYLGDDEKIILDGASIMKDSISIIDAKIKI